jgi:hypothetical protein
MKEMNLQSSGVHWGEKVNITKDMMARALHCWFHACSIAMCLQLANSELKKSHISSKR